MDVLITSPTLYAQRFSEALTTCDVRFIPHCYPMIETVYAQPNLALEALAAQIDQYDYIVFTSRHAIQSFVPYVGEEGLPIDSLAIGKDNEALQVMLHTVPAFVASEASPKGLVDVLRKHQVESKKIAVLVPKVVTIEEPATVPDFLKSLESIGLVVKRIEAYTTQPTEENLRKKAFQLLKEKRIACVAFTSGGEVGSFLQGMGQMFSQKEVLRLLENVKIACYGPYTASHARHLGLSVDYVSDRYSSFVDFSTNLSRFLR